MLADPRSEIAGQQFRRTSGSTCAIWNRSLPTCGSFRISTTICGRPSGRKRNSSSRASCAKTAACSNLLKADYTFLNERLAKHYGIPNVYGSRFRRCRMDKDSERGGLLRQGSILTVTSYATRTSPVIRGQVGSGKYHRDARLRRRRQTCRALKDNTVSATLSVRERLAEHRANAACASCHNMMDPVGFALENFDAVGRWRTLEEGKPVDATGGLPDGSKFTGVAGLEKGLLEPAGTICGTLAGKAADVRAGPWRRTLRCTGDSQDCHGGGSR